jgi:zinc transport system ATP-binding protein
MNKGLQTNTCDHSHHDGGCAPSAPLSDTNAIHVEHVSFSYLGRGSAGNKPTRVLEDVSLDVEAGMNLGIIGPNGAGKTTLLRIMLGLIEGYTGTVSIAGLSPAQACRRGDIVGYVPQRSGAESRFPLSARQVVRLGLVGKTGLFRRYSPPDLEYAEQMMRHVGAAHLADTPIGELSGGQQQRIFIARALVAHPRIVILDEPMSGIDATGQREIGSLIRDLHQSLKLTVVVVSHDIEALAAGCTKIACLRKTIHYHDASHGLTPQVLRAVFQHGYDAVVGSERVQGIERVQGSGFRVQEGGEALDATESAGVIAPSEEPYQSPPAALPTLNSDRLPRTLNPEP